MDLTAGTLLTGGALVGLLVGFWSRLKTLVWRVANLLIVRAEFRSDMAPAVRDWLFLNGRQRMGGTRVYMALVEFLRPLKGYGLVPYRDLGQDPLLFTIGRWPLLARFGRQPEGLANRDSGADSGVVLLFLRGTYSADTIAAEAARQWNKTAFVGIGRRWSITVLAGQRRTTQDPAPVGFAYSKSDSKPPSPASLRQAGLIVGYTPEEIGQPFPPDPFLGLVYPAPIEGAATEVGRWLQSREWYEQRGIPWRRGWLLYGPPGCGKSRLVRALSHRFDLPVYLFDLATMDNRDLEQGWQSALSNIPALVLFEDIDAVFNGRENVAGDDSRVTFDKLLGLLSGVGNSDGLFVVVTTNRPERLDPALGAPDQDGLSTRPGRIDRVIRLGPPAEDERRRIVAHIASYSGPDEVDRLTAETDGKSAAQVVEAAARVALEKYWSTKTPESA
jgi:hypothetical protein